MGLSDNFNLEIHSIESRFNGGLSNTSTKKFDELIVTDTAGRELGKYVVQSSVLLDYVRLVEFKVICR